MSSALPLLLGQREGGRGMAEDEEAGQASTAVGEGGAEELRLPLAGVPLLLLTSSPSV